MNLFCYKTKHLQFFVNALFNILPVVCTICMSNARYQPKVVRYTEKIKTPSSPRQVASDQMNQTTNHYAA